VIMVVIRYGGRQFQVIQFMCAYDSNKIKVQVLYRITFLTLLYQLHTFNLFVYQAEVKQWIPPIIYEQW
jgi:hypothetical protein